LIAACHSGESRELLVVHTVSSDAGSDAAVDGSGVLTPSSDAGDDAALSDGGDAEGGIEGGAEIDGGASCGDGHTDLGLAEECDDGNQRHSDGCEIDCKKTRITQLGLGRFFTCALSSGGGVKCWGTDNFGVLGRGTTGEHVADPTQIDVLDFGTSRRVKQLVSSVFHSCVVFEDEKARCWGRNDYGQLGIGSKTHYADEPSESLGALDDLPIDQIKAISVSEQNTCVISDTSGSNRLYCWGSNAQGQLGIGATVDKTTADTNDPAQLTELPTQITSGYLAACAVYDAGLVRCFGSHVYGQLGCGVIDFDIGDGIGDGNGLGTLPNNFSLDVQGLPGAPSAIIGDFYTHGALIDDQLYCWGRNTDAQTGHPIASVGTEVWQAVGPVNLGDVSVMQAALGSSHGCALDDRGVVRCWGRSIQGALGYPGHSDVGRDRAPVLDYQVMSGLFVDGGPTDAAIPGAESLPLGAVNIGDFDGTPGLDPATHVWVGQSASCALTEEGGLRCWGFNEGNHLGYGTAVANIGLTQSPAELYAQVGFADVKVFGPPP
jgi:cysteine-rich repeat protein